ncbi:glycosyltransferase family 4 protein [Phycisphaerales bacterium AB-hyl4]|uniref:Glycosyltransferase family 4 protein n=1 Tax=Natronomicrosphaera hydrolytica TaxID=3242702 RepID=A0ABV4U0M0_9BACT
MRIALVIETFNPTSGGAERSTATIANHLIQRGHEVTVLTGYCPEDLPTQPGLTVKTAMLGRPRGVLRLATFVRWASRQLTEYDVSLSVTTSVPASVVQPRAGLVMQAQARSVARRDTSLARAAKRFAIACSTRQIALRLAERRTMRDPFVQQFVAISQYVARDMLRYYAIGDDRITIIPNASEMPSVDAAQRAAWRREIRQSFNIPDDTVMYLFPAIDPWRKGILPLMRAAAQLKQRGVPFVIALAGSVSHTQQRLAEQMQLREQVRMVGRTEQMAALFCAADVTVLPTFHDPSSKVIIESLMMGTPAISSGYNGASDFIEPHDTAGSRRGRVVHEPDDVAGLCQAMTELADAAERERCAKATAGLAESLTMSRHVERLEPVLEAAAEQQRKQSGHSAAASVASSTESVERG